MNGLLVLDKPQGWASAQLVRTLGRRLGVNKIGHTGTLDPLATGVLPTLLGEATKISSFLTALDKTYICEVTLGQATDTYDAMGKALKEAVNCDHLSRQDIEKTLQTFRGRISQVPPPYSAKKINGQRAYSLARQGQAVMPKAQDVEVFDLRVLFWRPPLLGLEVRASKGTYVRSLAHDLGVTLAVGGHLSQLRRTRVGPFDLSQSLSWDWIEKFLAKSADCVEMASVLPRYLMNPAEALADLPCVKLDSNQVRHIRQGRDPNHPQLLAVFKDCHSQEAVIKALDPQGDLVALIQSDKPQAGRGNPYGLLKVLRVFNAVSLQSQP